MIISRVPFPLPPSVVIIHIYIIDCNSAQRSNLVCVSPPSAFCLNSQEHSNILFPVLIFTSVDRGLDGIRNVRISLSFQYVERIGFGFTAVCPGVCRERATP